MRKKCPQCGQTLVIKAGAGGDFLGCSGYPNCKYIEQERVGVPCPLCSEGQVVVKPLPQGKTLYGCDRYPRCKFTAWHRPVDEPCPECGSPYLLTKAERVLACPNKDCRYQRKDPRPAAKRS